MAKNDLGSWNLGPEHVGQRVVVRRRLGVVDGRQRFTDVLGELTGLTPATLTVLTRDGSVEVPVAEVHRAKTVPPRSGVTARDIAALERAATAAWPPVTVERLGDWQLRAADGYTGRANSALPLGDPGVTLPEALDRVVDFYRSRDLPAQVDVPLPLASTVARELRKQGWTAQCDVEVLATDLTGLITATPEGEGFRLDPQPSEQAMALISGRRGPLPQAAHHVLTAVDELIFAEWYGADGELLCMGRGSVTDGWLGLFAIETVPAARRQGLAVGAVGALARWAGRLGAQRAFLQVESTNEAALALYAKLGFVRHHSYTRYRR